MKKGQRFELSINADGKVRSIYDDASRDVLEEIGTVDVRRASNVEPDGANWRVDLSPVGGPVVRPFRYRQEALDFEVEWLRRNWL